MEKIIQIDCDGVLADFDTMFIYRVKEYCGITIREGYSFDDIEIKNLPKDFWAWLFNLEGNILGLKKLPEADYLLNRLRSFGKVIACTSVTTAIYAYERFSWLEEQCNFDRKDISLVYHKYLMHSDVFIDDRPSNVLQWMKRHPKGIPVLWNKGRKIEGAVCTTDVDELISSLIIRFEFQNQHS